MGGKKPNSRCLFSCRVILVDTKLGVGRVEAKPSYQGLSVPAQDSGQWNEVNYGKIVTSLQNTVPLPSDVLAGLKHQRWSHHTKEVQGLLWPLTWNPKPSLTLWKQTHV